MAKTYCPSCDAVIARDNPRVGAMITCQECDTELEIISTNPFEVDFSLDYDEEWDDEVEDDEDTY
jgi:lysine biosynthesis protein LysW